MDKLTKYTVELLSDLDLLYENALYTDCTDMFLDYVEDTIKHYGIILMCIKGYMRSAKSTSAFTLGFLFRFLQKKYIDYKLLNLVPENCIRKNQSHLINHLQEQHYDSISICDEDIAFTGVGSQAEDLTIRNLMEVCARARNHVIFLNPSEFVYPEVCKYGLIFHDRDTKNKTSRFMLYDLGKGHDKKIYIPLGLVTIPKLVDSKWKEENQFNKCIVDDKEVYIGQRFDSEFEYKYETGIKLEIVHDQMQLKSSKVRSERLFGMVDEFKQDLEFKKNILKLSNKAMDCKRYIRGYVAHKLAGVYNGIEIQQLTDYVEGIRNIMFDDGE